MAGIYTAAFEECLDTFSLARGEVRQQITRRVRMGNSDVGKTGAGR